MLSDSSGAWVLSNRDEAGVTRLPHGFYGVTNSTLDVPWPKVGLSSSFVFSTVGTRVTKNIVVFVYFLTTGVSFRTTNVREYYRY